MMIKLTPRAIQFKTLLSILFILSIIVTGKSQNHDTGEKLSTASDARKKLMGTWVMVDDSTVKILITKDSIFYLRQNKNGIPNHRNRVNAYELSETHCGASFVNSITGFYIVEHTITDGKQNDSCLPIQVLNDNWLTLFQSIPQADIYSGALELRYKRAK
jgi:hypothetical protein